MPTPDVIVIGGSAGAFEALYALAGGLPATFPPSLCVSLHLPPYSRSQLPDIIRRRGALPARYATDREPLEPGTIYVAPPDHHLLVARGFVRVVQGPREHNARPAIDPLFRTAAVSYGPRVVGVLFSGLLDDGSAGLQAIKDQGGVTVVQDPTEALYADMPNNAIREVEIDHVLRVEEMIPLLVGLSRQPVRAAAAAPSDKLKWEAAMNEWDLAALDSPARPGAPSSFMCPHCKGSLWEDTDHGEPRFRCRTGHAWSALSLLAAQSEGLDATLNEAFRALKEKQHLSLRLAKQARAGANTAAATHYEREAESLDRFAHNLWKMLMEIEQGNPPQDE